MSEVIAVDVQAIARELELSAASVEKTIALLDAGNTIPFITRYRRDATGGLDEQQIERIHECIARERQLAERKQTILRSLASQNKLTPELQAEVEAAGDLRRLEDLYLPYKPKKQTLAAKAREQGLGPLADEIVSDAPSANDLDARAADFVNEDKGINEAALALVGAGHVLAERFSEMADLRRLLRKHYRKTAKVVAVQVVKDHKKLSLYKDYLNYSDSLARVKPHRTLALNRGEREKILRVGVEADNEGLFSIASEMLVPAEHSHRDFLSGCVRDALDRLVIPSLERECRRELTEQAESHSVEVFARNLRAILLQPPVQGRRVLAIDPGYKNGCKLAALDETGQPIAMGLVHVTGSEEGRAVAKTKLRELIEQHNLDLIAIGNGSACRQSETLVAELLGEAFTERKVEYVIVNEAGASVYSTSAIGREELPEIEAIQRSAISIGRRMQDPLSELVKIDPASIGVGLYQHDAKAKHLRDSLENVVRACVSFVGVDLNTASPALLGYVSGLNQLTARRIVEHRNTHGRFASREALKQVTGIGDATFVQAAGFLKVDGGDTPLDRTWVHPESYQVATRLLERLNLPLEEITTGKATDKFHEGLAGRDRNTLASDLGVGTLALEQLIEALERPGRDLRADLPPPIFRRDVVKLEDLEVGMPLHGTVLNVVDFGAFVDVGLSDSGLVHISQMSTDFVRDPHSIVAAGDQVACWVASIDRERRRVALTMLAPGTPRPEREAKPKHQRPPRPAKPTGGDNKPGGDATRDRPRPPRKRPPRGKKQESREPQPTGFEKRAKREVVPLTKEMEQGKEAMRSFSDLLQFVKKKQKDEPETKN